MVELATRFDSYDDVGNSFNYSLGSKYTPHDIIAFRGRYATSFKAVPLNYINISGPGGYNSIRDQRYCEKHSSTCDSKRPLNSILMAETGNEDLNPEVGFNYSAGIILQPIKDLSIVADYYWVSLSDTFSQDSAQDIADWLVCGTNEPTEGAEEE